MEISAMRGRHCPRGKPSAFDPPIMQRLTPELLEVSAGVLFLPVGANEIISGRIGLTREQSDKFQRTLSVVERRDQRLDNADGAIVGAHIAPGLELMSRADVPLAEFRGFVLIEAMMDAKRNLAALERGGKGQVSERFVRRIAA